MRMKRSKEYNSRARLFTGHGVESNIVVCV